MSQNDAKIAQAIKLIDRFLHLMRSAAIGFFQESEIFVQDG